MRLFRVSSSLAASSPAVQPGVAARMEAGRLVREAGVAAPTGLHEFLIIDARGGPAQQRDHCVRQARRARRLGPGLERCGRLSARFGSADDRQSLHKLRRGERLVDGAKRGFVADGGVLAIERFAQGARAVQQAQIKVLALIGGDASAHGGDGGLTRDLFTAGVFR